MNLTVDKAEWIMEKIYIGFKGTHNASCRLVQALPGNRYFLTNSFSGLKKDMDVLVSSCGCVYVAMVKQVVESEAINDEDVE